MTLHPVEHRGYEPWWEPVVCIGFDLLVFGFMLAVVTSSRQLTQGGV